MNVDAVTDVPDEDPVELALLPGQRVAASSGWMIENTGKPGSRPLWLHFVSKLGADGRTATVYVWDAGGGKESLYGEMGPDEGHPYPVRDEENTEHVVMRQDPLARGSIAVYRSQVFVGGDDA